MLKDNASILCGNCKILGICLQPLKKVKQPIKTFLLLKLEKTITDTAQRLVGFENIKSIKGIGDVNEFKDEGKLTAYFGLVPRVSNSNETERSGQITKRSSKIGLS